MNKNLCTKILFFILVQYSSSALTAEFVGNPKIELLDDGRNARFVEDFTFVADDGNEWTALAGSEVDGATIPRRLWSSIGAPYVGKYRNAALIHDHFTPSETHTKEVVDQMFFEALLHSGVPEIKAWLMFIAVDIAGPKWEVGGNQKNFDGEVKQEVVYKDISLDEWANLSQRLEEKYESGASLEELVEISRQEISDNPETITYE